MRDTEANTRRKVLDQARQVCQLLRQHGDSDAADSLERDLERYSNERFMIAVLGKAKRGKSTLINALLGRHDDLVAPVDKLPASSAVTRFFWEPQERATVVFRDRRQEQVGYERVRDYVTEERNPENRKGVDVVEVSGPFLGLQKDVILLDTPGAGSIHEYHDAILHAFIPQADAIIFLVTARMPLDQDELDLLREVKDADIRKVFFAVNRVDESNEKDIQDAIAHNRKLLSQVGVPVEQIHRISGRTAFTGKASDSGVPDLVGEIQLFLSKNKGRLYNARLAGRVLQAAAPTVQSLEVELTSAKKSDSDLDRDLGQLRESKRMIEQDRQFTEREFMLQWERAIEHFEHAVRETKAEARSAVLAHIDRASLTTIGKLARDLPGYISKTVEDMLASAARSLEESLAAAAQHLKASYPSIEVKSAGEVSIQSKTGHSVAIAGLSAGVALVSGAGLVAAGSAAAAGIAAANAAALTTTATVTAPGALAGIGSLLTSLGVPPAVGGILTTLATGTATVAAPAALTTTPLWVALSGPIGWTLAGVGVLAVPLSWRISKAKQKRQLEEAAADQVDEIFKLIQSERIPFLRKMRGSILEEFQIRLDRQIAKIESSLAEARNRRPDATRLTASSHLLNELGEVLDAVSAFGLDRTS